MKPSIRSIGTCEVKGCEKYARFSINYDAPPENSAEFKLPYVMLAMMCPIHAKMLIVPRMDIIALESYGWSGFLFPSQETKQVSQWGSRGID